MAEINITNNIVEVTQDSPNVVEVAQEITNVIEVSTPGIQGPVGPPGSGSASTLTDGNGTTASGSSINIGGTLTAETRINANSNNFTISGSNSKIYLITSASETDISDGIHIEEHGVGQVQLETRTGDIYLTNQETGNTYLQSVGGQISISAYANSVGIWAGTDASIIGSSSAVIGITESALAFIPNSSYFIDTKAIKTGLEYDFDIDGSGFTSQSLIHLGFSDLRYAPLSGSNSYWGLANGALLTGPNIVSGTTTNTIKFVFNNLGATATDGAGLLLANTTPSTASLMQYAPSLVFMGSGWSSASGSQSVRVRHLVGSFTSSPNAGLSYVIQSSINDATYNNIFSYSIPGGILTVPSTIRSENGALVIQTVGNNTPTIGNSGATAMVSALVVTNTLSYTSTKGAAVTHLHLGVNSFNASSGSSTFSSLGIFNTINQTGTANGQITIINNNPTISSAVNVIGIDWNPSTPNNISGTHLAFRATSGNVLIGATTITANTRLDIRGTSTSSNLALRIADSANIPSVTITDVGNTNIRGSLTVSGTLLHMSSSIFSGSVNIASGVAFEMAGFNPATYHAKIGTFYVQSYALNNAFVAENAYFDGAWRRVSTGYTEGFQYFDGQFTAWTANTGASGSTFTPQVNLKTRYNGEFGIGGDGTFSTGLYTGNYLKGSSTGLIGIGGMVVSSVSSRLHVRGIGASSSGLFLLEDSNGVARYSTTDVGAHSFVGASFSVAATGTIGLSTVGTVSISGLNTFLAGTAVTIQSAGGGNVMNLSTNGGGYIFGAGSSTTQVNSFLFGQTWNPAAGAVTHSNITINSTISSSGTYTGEVYGFNYAPTLTSMVGVTAHYAFRATSGKLLLGETPANNDALTQILVRDSSSGEIKYRDASSLVSGGSTTGSFTGSFTGSVLGTASYAVNSLSASWAPGGSSSTTGSFTGSFTGSVLGTASWASNALQSNTASFIATASWAISASSVPSASHLLNTASWATSASHARTASFIATSSWAVSASWAPQAGSSTTGSFTGSFTGSVLGTSSYAISASWAPGGVGSTTGSYTGSFNGAHSGSFSGSLTSSQINVLKTGSLNIFIDGRGSAISVGSKGKVYIPYDSVISGWSIFGEESGSCVFNIMKSTYSTYPVSASIAGSEKPTIVNHIKNEDNTLTTFTSSLSSGDIIEFVAESITTFTKLNIVLKTIKN